MAEPKKKTAPTTMFGVDLPVDLLGGDFLGSALAAFQMLDGVDKIPVLNEAGIEKAKRVRVLPAPSIPNSMC